jgi:mono/diheme cytochrome c family protein
LSAARLLALCAVLLAVAVSAFGQRPPELRSSTVRAYSPSTQSRPNESTPARGGNIEHGRYMVEQVVMCAECHSTRDTEGNISPETRFMGGPIPVRPPWPNDWAVRAPRIAGLPGYTEELAVRLLTQGALGRDNRQLRPPMPRFHMTPQDAADVVAYLKSLP